MFGNTPAGLAEAESLPEEARAPRGVLLEKDSLTTEKTKIGHSQNRDHNTEANHPSADLPIDTNRKKSHSRVSNGYWRPAPTSPRELKAWKKKGYLNPEGIETYPPDSPSANYTHTMQISSVALRGSGDIESFKADLEAVAPLFAKCGIKVEKISLHQVSATPIDYKESSNQQLGKSFNKSFPSSIAKPTVVLLRSLPQGQLGVAALGGGNTGHSEVFFSGSELKKLKSHQSVSAHELMHMMGGCQHVPDKNNVMAAEAFGGTEITQSQCAQLKTSKLLKPIGSR